jgi:hypothetical protein
MGFNQRKWEDERRREAEKAATARRARDPQVRADALRLVTEWNERQAQRAPLLFSPTIGAAIAAMHWYLVGPLPCMLHDQGARPARARSASRHDDHQPDPGVVMPQLPAKCAVRRGREAVTAEHCRRDARRTPQAGIGRLRVSSLAALVELVAVAGGFKSPTGSRFLAVKRIAEIDRQAMLFYGFQIGGADPILEVIGSNTKVSKKAVWFTLFVLSSFPGHLI